MLMMMLLLRVFHEQIVFFPCQANRKRRQSKVGANHIIINEDSMMRPAFNEMHEIFRLLNLPLNHCYIATLIHKKISLLGLLKMERNYDDVDEDNNDDNHDQDGGDDVVDDDDDDDDDDYYVD